ncbi:MAG: ABC transporter ATP-binding protein [Micrococcales bacterium]|nr:ABC transporter ATP-binding protein [Micrococcales bacterium]
MHAEVDARRTVLDLELAEGQTVAVLGPNGAGKSTLLAVIAGLLVPDRGRVRLGGVVLTDVERRIRMPPHRRRIALLAQQPALFPHLSVLGNVMFAARSAGVRGPAARTDARRRLEEVGAGALADARATEVSGGEAQRIALARALAADPRLLLLDEPLSALDAGAAPPVRRVLRTVLAGRSAVLVTHDPLDAWALADRVVVLESGRVVETGSTDAVLRHPRSAFAAELVGLSIVRGIRTAPGIRVPDGREVPAAPAAPAAIGAAAVAPVRPSGVRVAGPAEGVPAIITALEPRGDVLRIRTDLVAADAPPWAAGELREGDRIGLEIDPGAVDVREL